MGTDIWVSVSAIIERGGHETDVDVIELGRDQEVDTVEHLSYIKRTIGPGLYILVLYGICELGAIILGLQCSEFKLCYEHIGNELCRNLCFEGHVLG